MRKLHILSYISLAYGGFLVILYLTTVYFAVWRQEFFELSPERGRRILPSNVSLPSPMPNGGRVLDPLPIVFSLSSVGILFTGILFLLNGYYTLQYLKQKELKETKQFVVSSLLSPEEKILLNELIKAGKQATQKQLGIKTGFSPVKTYRIIRRLEAKKLVKSYPFGMTNKVVLVESD